MDLGIYNQVVNRAIQPQMRPEIYKTYMIAQPLSTHFRKATCDEVGCVYKANGWRTVIDVSTALGAKQANYIRLQSGRSYTTMELGAMVTFIFPSGQECFTQHRTTIDRPQIFVVKDGDFRGNPRGTPVTIRKAEDWQDDFANHQDKLATRLEQG